MNNHFLHDPNLSTSAKGLLAVILSNKDDWRIYPEEISKRSKDGLRSHQSSFEELERNGYMRTVKRGMGRGKGIQRYRFVQDIPITDDYFEYLKSKFDREFSANDNIEDWQK